MTIKLGLKLTTAGLAEFAAAITEERLVDITQMVLGDANGAWYEITGNEVALLNEQARFPLLQICRDPVNLNRIICDAPIPVDVGGFAIREFGLLSAAGVLLAIGMHQIIDLPAPGGPVTLDMVIRGLLDVVNAEVVDLVVDPYIVTATRKYVDDAIALKAPLASPSLTGVPLTPTAAPGTNTTQISSTAFVQAAIAALLDSAPGALDTLNELAAALADDPDFATTITNAIALKAPLASPSLTGVPLAPTAALGTNNTQIATTAFLRNAFAGNAAANGYQKLPNGLILIWGTVALSFGGFAYNLPTSFPTAHLWAGCTGTYNNAVNCGASPLDVNRVNLSTGGAMTVSYLCIGY